MHVVRDESFNFVKIHNFMFEYILCNIPEYIYFFFFPPMRKHRFWFRVHARDTKMNRKPIISFGGEMCGRTRLPVRSFYVLKGNKEQNVILENTSVPFLKSLSFLLAYHTKTRRQT
jgi:hypothetical protein